MIAAIAFAERGVAETDAEAKREIAAVMRHVGTELGNTPAVARSSYVSPAVIDQYLDGTTIEDSDPDICVSSAPAIWDLTRKNRLS